MGSCETKLHAAAELYLQIEAPTGAKTKKELQMSETNWTRHRDPISQYPRHIYEFLYKIIANANMVLENIDAAEGTDNERNYVKGQAIFYRAWRIHVYMRLFKGTITRLAL